MKTKIAFIALVAVLFLSCNAMKNNTSDEITGRQWKLKTLNGQDLSKAANQDKEIFFTLNTKENRMNGFSGCNNFFGEYVLQEGNRISFKNIGATKMACPDVNLNESDIYEVFNSADNYTINGDELSINVGRRAPLAVFVLVDKK